MVVLTVLTEMIFRDSCESLDELIDVVISYVSVYVDTRAETQRGARECYKNKIELKFKTGDMRTIWEGIKTTSDMQQNRQICYRLSPLGGRDDRVFAEDMNFYSRFDTNDFRSAIGDIRRSTKTDGEQVIEEKDVLRIFQCTHVKKSPAPDDISGQVLKNCATQLSSIFPFIFQVSLSLQKIPTLW